MKMRFKRFLSGFMAVATLASVIVQPVTVSASELEPETTSFEQQYPELQDVQDTLDKDEIVKAKASGDDGFFTEENGYGNLSAGARFILVHLAASYANGSSDAFYPPVAVPVKDNLQRCS